MDANKMFCIRYYVLLLRSFLYVTILAWLFLHLSDKMNVNTNEFDNYLHVWIVRMSMASEEYNLSSDEDLDFGD